MTDTLRIVPLGGLGEVGMNCMAIEVGDDIVVIDCGIMFPDRAFGVDIIHPDFDYLIRHQQRVRAVVLTHGHEDHIGAIPFLLRALEVPIYGPAYALALVKERLTEHEGLPKPRLLNTTPRVAFRVGDVEIEPVRVTHSIADATALVLRTNAGVVVHSGDFKIDATSTDGSRFDAERFGAVGKEGVRLLLSDSTNADVPGASGSEASVATALARLLHEEKNRVVVALFASNVPRMRGIFDIARATNRRVCLIGRSVQTHTRVAAELKYLDAPSPLLISTQDAARAPRGSVIFVAGGTQGEPAAGLTRLAHDTHSDIHLEPDDVVLFSSRVIPGNEKPVMALIDQLERRGVRVRFRATDDDIHVTGHACRDEQRQMIELVQPRAFLPIHGGYHQLSRHAALAKETGVAETLVVENGTVVEVSDRGLSVEGKTQTGRVFVDSGAAVPDVVLKDRQLLAEHGIAVATFIVDKKGRLVGEPEVITRGLVQEEGSDELLEDASDHVGDAIRAHHSPRLDFDEDETRDVARRALKRFFGKRIGKKPLTYAILHRAD